MIERENKEEAERHTANYGTYNIISTGWTQTIPFFNICHFNTCFFYDLFMFFYSWNNTRVNGLKMS